MSYTAFTQQDVRELMELLANRAQQVRIHVRGGDDRYLTEDEVDLIKDALYCLYCNPKPVRG